MTGLTDLIGDFAALLTPDPDNDEHLTRWIEQANIFRTAEHPHPPNTKINCYHRLNSSSAVQCREKVSVAGVDLPLGSSQVPKTLGVDLGPAKLGRPKQRLVTSA